MARHAAAYDTQLSLFEELRVEAEFAIRAAFRDHSVKLHSIRSRVKSRESFLGKVTRKGYTSPFEQMPDLVGARIVCLFLDDLPTIENVLKSIFDVFDEDDKTASSPPELFRYQSIHYQARIRSDHIGPHYDSIKQFDFEIQTRTILQDAWASVEHTLAYKGAQSIPNELKRDINALVGLFHVADKSFQHLRDDIARSEQAARELVEDAGDKIEMSDAESDAVVTVNRGTLKALLRQLYPERARSENIEYSRFAEELAAVGIVAIDHLRKMLSDNDSAGHEFEASLNSGNSDERSQQALYFTDIGFARTITAHAVEEYEPPVDENDEEDDEEAGDY